MTEARVRNHLSYLLIISHFFVFILVLVLWVVRAFDFPQMTTTVALILPMFATYTTAVVQYIIQNRSQADRSSREVTQGFVFVSFLVPSTFITVIAALILLKAFNLGFDGFDQFKISLAICESAFGVYVGKVVAALFHKK